MADAASQNSAEPVTRESYNEQEIDRLSFVARIKSPGSAMSKVCSVEPARPCQLTVDFNRTDDRLSLVWRSRPRGWCAFFTPLWLLAWTVGCIVLAQKVFYEPSAIRVILAVAFGSAWVFVAFIIVRSIAERDELFLDSRGAAHTYRILVPLRARTVPLEEIEGFECRDSCFEHGITMLTRGKPLRFACGLSQPGLQDQTAWNAAEPGGTPVAYDLGLSDAERIWLVNELNDHLARIKGTNRDTSGLAADFRWSPNESQEPVRIVASPRLIRAPSDCRWRRVDDLGGIRFVLPGHWDVSALLVFLFINVFFDCVLLGFLTGLFGDEMDRPEGLFWWFIFLFLVPFEAIALFLFSALVVMALSRFSQTVWRLTDKALVRQRTWFGVGPRRTYPMARVGRLELKRLDDRELVRRRSWWQPSMVLGRSRGDDTVFRLSLIDADDRAMCSLDELTEGEARWIGDVILRERRSWFR